MRCHVVTPKAPVHVTLFPFVDLGQAGQVFHPGWNQPVKLPINTYWVLHLPFIYKSKTLSLVKGNEMNWHISDGFDLKLNHFVNVAKAEVV
jgi:hypothetical protein